MGTRQSTVETKPKKGYLWKRFLSADSRDILQTDPSNKEVLRRSDDWEKRFNANTDFIPLRKESLFIN